MKHIVKLSGGKDSTCMLLMMLEKGMQIDEIVFCDTGLEFPEIYDHLNKLEEYTGRKITRLKSNKTFRYYLAEHVITRGKHVGQHGYGWPSQRIRWCTSRLKTLVSDRYLKKYANDYVLYIGIAADEPKRHERMANNVRHPLFDWGITEAEALKYCYDHGFDWGGLYEKFDRTGCWCCPFQSQKDLSIIRKYYPDLWKKFLELDALTPSNFKVTLSLKEIEQKIINREETKDDQR